MVDLYENMWQNAYPFLQNGKVKTDPFLYAAEGEDTRRGITLLFRPPNQILKNIEAFLKEAQQIEQEQYFYPTTDMHLTVLSVISCFPGFDLQKVEPQEYLNLIGDVVKQIAPFQLTFKGLTASPQTIMIQGYDESGQLNELRQLLREKFKPSSLENSIDTRYKIQSAHMTVIRFAYHLRDSNTFLKVLESSRQIDYGTCDVNVLELVFNDWYLQKKHVQSLGLIKLAC